MPFMGPDFEINSILFYSILYIMLAQKRVCTKACQRNSAFVPPIVR